jgi:hypothetical protein
MSLGYTSGGIRFPIRADLSARKNAERGFIEAQKRFPSF